MSNIILSSNIENYKSLQNILTLISKIATDVIISFYKKKDNLYFKINTLDDSNIYTFSISYFLTENYKLEPNKHDMMINLDLLCSYLKTNIKFTNIKFKIKLNTPNIFNMKLLGNIDKKISLNLINIPDDMKKTQNHINKILKNEFKILTTIKINPKIFMSIINETISIDSHSHLINIEIKNSQVYMSHQHYKNITNYHIKDAIIKLNENNNDKIFTINLLILIKTIDIIKISDKLTLNFTYNTLTLEIIKLNLFSSKFLLSLYNN